MKKFSVLLATNSVKAYQYLAPDDLNLKKGMIVKVPFRSRELFGVIWDESDEELEESKLKKMKANSIKLKYSNAASQISNYALSLIKNV